MTPQNSPQPTRVTNKIGVTLLAILCVATAARYYWDYQASQDPECLSLRESYFYRSETLAKLANQCLGDIKLDEAKSLAETALHRQPHNQLALAVLGSVADLRSDHKMADSWMRAASSLGHRDYSVETYWLERASSSKNFFKQAQHIDALYRSGWGNDAIADETRAIEGTPAGRRALLPLIRGTSPWITSFLMNVRKLSDPELMNRRALLLDAAHGRPGTTASQTVDLLTASPVILELQRRGMSEQAIRLRASFQPYSRGSFINDGRFASADKNYGPFDWKLSSSPGLEISTVRTSSAHSGLHLQADVPGRYDIAQQLIRLPAGSYRIRMTGRMNADESATAGKIVVNLVASDGKSHLDTLQLTVPQAARPSEAFFNVPNAEPYYRLTLSLDTLDSDQGIDIDLTSIDIERAADKP